MFSLTVLCVYTVHHTHTHSHTHTHTHTQPHGRRGAADVLADSSAEHGAAVGGGRSLLAMY